MTRRAADPARLARAMFLAALAAVPTVASAQYEADPGYYATVNTQTGTALKNQLAAVMAAGHAQTDYGQARDYMAVTDTNPANGRQLLLFYTRAIVNKTSSTQQGFINDPSGDPNRQYNSREHVWPDSLQGPGDTNNETAGSRGDIHMLKPCEDGINGVRGNQYFVGATTTGAARNVTGGFYAGDVDRGDAARIIFYGATRWQSGAGSGSSSLSIKDGTSGTNTQMGDLNSLLHWHYLDTPDQFELRRNDVIFRGDDSQTATVDDVAGWAGTRNRNAYIDRPEYAWSVYRDQENDTKLTLAAGSGGGTTAADGGSTATVNLGRVLRGAPVPGAQTITLNKAGVDGTYYQVTAADGATSTVSGRYNAFAMDAAGSRTLAVGLNTTTTAAGLKSGTVTIDNLDVTTGLGAGFGAGDANDVATVQLSVLDASNPTFSASADVDALTLDFGTVRQGESAEAKPFSIFDRASTLGAALTAALDLDSIAASGATSAFSTTLALFSNLAAGDVGQAFAASFDTSTLGQFTAVYTLGLSDENLPGTVTTSTLRLTLTGAVTAVPEPLSISLASLFVVAFARRRRSIG